MPLQIRMTDLSVPQGWVLPDASINSDGVMTAAMVRALNSLSPPGAFTDLPLDVGFSEPGNNLSNLGARLVGDGVQFQGAVAVDAGGVGPGSQITQMPIGMRPSKTRLIPTAVVTINGNAVVVNDIVVDDAAGSQSGTPGAVFVGVTITAGANKVIAFDGLSFLL